MSYVSRIPEENDQLMVLLLQENNQRYASWIVLVHFITLQHTTILYI